MTTQKEVIQRRGRGKGKGRGRGVSRYCICLFIFVEMCNMNQGCDQNPLLKVCVSLGE